MIQREILSEIEKHLFHDKILILKGARQTGKTTIMKMLQKKIEETGSMTAFFLADNLSQQDIFSTPQTLIDYLRITYNFPKAFSQKPLFLFIDEFQYIKNAGLFLKNLFDQYSSELKIIVSGSSSLEITKNTEFLTGRHFSFLIDRISFSEFFYYKKPEMRQNNFLLSDWKEIETYNNVLQKELQQSFLEYIRFGAYPAVIKQKTLENKKLELSTLLNTYLEKDIITFLRIENIRVFKNLIKIFADQVGSLLNIRRIASTLGSSQETINKYINILEGTYVCTRLKPFFTNTAKSLRRMPKIFMNDVGIINITNNDIDNFNDKINYGDIVENFIYLELFRKHQDHLFFYRTAAGSEIDFIIEKKEISLIEVKYRNTSPKNFLAFSNFKNTVLNKKINKKIIITKNDLKVVDDVYYIPAYLFPFIDCDF
ncbi:hypothetical protein COB57_05730 [Candidatus Peregrinibacteria bacterium]|nr:MAG: hypothetical protein COB57_05730 [Candidatus Peregrinibacteria bacterium]